MSHRDLLKKRDKLETEDMRLPQSLTQHRPNRFLFIAVALCAAMLPLCARANAQQLSCSPSSLFFGSVAVGKSETAVVVLTNAGKTSVTVSAMKTSGAAFRAPGLTLPLTLAAGQSVPVNVTYSPSATGWTQGGITFSSNASNTALQLELGGSGATIESLAPSPANVSFGQVAVGTKSTKPVVLTNTVSWKTTLYAFQMTGSEFSVSGATLPVTLNPGQSLTVNLTFAPQTSGASAGELFVTGPNVTVPLSGTGATTTAAGQLSITPTSVNFGDMNVGSTGTQPITMSASGASVTVSADSSNASQFALQGATLPVTIAAGKSLSYNVAFKPTASGAVSGSLSFTSNASNSPKLSVPLSGTGTTTTTAGKLSVIPSSVSFGDVSVGATGTQAISMGASGASVTVSADASSSSQFVLEGATLPFTIPAGQSVSYNVAFKPTASATVSGSLSFTSNAASSPTVESLTGVGTASSQYSVGLSWNASSDVVGYNVYRSTSSNGAFAKINSSLDANTTYTDSTVAAGQTYYYEATSVNSAGQESALSTPSVEASIP
jgi:hypothetical protein